MRLLAIVLSVVISTVALAQPRANEIEARISAHIGALTIQNTSLTVQVEQLTKTLSDAQDKIKDLEAKLKADKQGQ